ncbi:MAG TPA: hypothetical protein VM681_02715 [Candidatus Thermoplasmatota archaeon]|nr:hypothetical protein [Candidatus Thermoplasmatota archaeon]
MTKPADAHLMSLKGRFVEASFNFPMPSMEAAEHIANHVDPWLETDLQALCDLDARLGLRGSLSKPFEQVEEAIARLKHEVDGDNVQSLVDSMNRADAALKSARKRCVG